MNVALSGRSAAVLPFKSLRVIPYQEYTGVQNMALDLMFSGLVEKTTVPVLRFYGWKPYCLSLGYHQKTDDIDLKKLKKNGYDVVRRPTGSYHAATPKYVPAAISPPSTQLTPPFEVRL